MAAKGWKGSGMVFIHRFLVASINFCQKVGLGGWLGGMVSGLVITSFKAKGRPHN